MLNPAKSENVTESEMSPKDLPHSRKQYYESQRGQRSAEPTIETVLGAAAARQHEINPHASQAEDDEHRNRQSVMGHVSDGSSLPFP